MSACWPETIKLWHRNEFMNSNMAFLQFVEKSLINIQKYHFKVKKETSVY